WLRGERQRGRRGMALPLRTDGAEEVVFERDGQSFSYGTTDPGAPELTELLNVEPHVLLIGVLASAQPKQFHSDSVEALRLVRSWFRRGLRRWNSVFPGMS